MAKPIPIEPAGPDTHLSSYWKQKRFDFTTGDLDYMGKHKNQNAPTSDSDWIVWKFTWSSSLPTVIKGPLSGSWDNRASLLW